MCFEKYDQEINKNIQSRLRLARTTVGFAVYTGFSNPSSIDLVRRSFKFEDQNVNKPSWKEKC